MIYHLKAYTLGFPLCITLIIAFKCIKIALNENLNEASLLYLFTS